MAKEIKKEQLNGKLHLTDEQKSQGRVTVLSSAVMKAIQESSNGMEGLTICEITAVLSTALISYNRRGIQAQFHGQQNTGS